MNFAIYVRGNVEPIGFCAKDDVKRLLGEGLAERLGGSPFSFMLKVAPDDVPWLKLEKPQIEIAETNYDEAEEKALWDMLTDFDEEPQHGAAPS